MASAAWVAAARSRPPASRSCARWWIWRKLTTAMQWRWRVASAAIQTDIDEFVALARPLAEAHGFVGGVEQLPHESPASPTTSSSCTAT